MPYGGKPSKGCAICRKRKIACDQLPGGCTQCGRVKRTCPGYRDHLSLLFKNENDDVARKAKIKWNKASAAAGAGSASTSISSSPQSSSITTPENNKASAAVECVSASTSISSSSKTSSTTASENNKEVICIDTYDRTPQLTYSYDFPIPIDDRGTSFFYTNYVVSGEILPAQIDNHLLTSMTAIGLAGMASRGNCAQYMREATKKYLTAVQLVNAALRSPEQVKSDSTLQAVLNLGMFENVSGTNKQSLQAWTTHMNGAASLIKLRGRSQIFSVRGRRLFLQTMMSLLVNCIAHETALPTHFLELRDEMNKHFDKSNYLPWQFHNEMVRITLFRHDIKTGVLRDPHLILATALDMDHDIEALFTQADPQWQYQTIANAEPDPSVIPYGFYHLYPSFWAAQLWNGMRVLRLILNTVAKHILNFLLTSTFSIPFGFSPAEHEAQLQRCLATMSQMQTGIIASIPQHIGYTSKSGQLVDAFDSTGTAQQAPLMVAMRWMDLTTVPALSNHFSSPAPNLNPDPNHSTEPPQSHPETSFPNSTANPEPEPEPDIPLVRTSGGYFLIWALYVAANTQSPSPEGREAKRYLIRMMRSIGRSMGMMLALVLAESLENGEHVAVLWDRQRHALFQGHQGIV